MELTFTSISPMQKLKTRRLLLTVFMAIISERYLGISINKNI